MFFSIFFVFYGWLLFFLFFIYLLLFYVFIFFSQEHGCTVSWRENRDGGIPGKGAQPGEQMPKILKIVGPQESLLAARRVVLDHMWEVTLHKRTIMRIARIKK